MLPFYNFIWLTVVAILGLMLVDMMLKAERPLFKAMAVRFNVFLLCCLGVQAWSVWMGQQKPEGYVLREDTVVDGFPLPTGTKLHFRWKKDIESYEYAVFPKPVEWKGVMIKAVERKFYDQNMGEGVFLKPTEVADRKPVWSEDWLCRVDAENFGWKYVGTKDKRTPSPDDYRLTGCQWDESFALPVPQLGENVKLGLHEVRYIESGKVWLAWLAPENMPFTGLITLDGKKNIVEIEIEPKQTDILGCVFDNVSLLTWNRDRPDIWTVSARPKAENELVEEHNVKQPETCWGRKLVYQY